MNYREKRSAMGLCYTTPPALLIPMQFIRGKKLKQIFLEHWQPFVKKHPDLRPAILKNVAKMLACGTQDLGFHLYQCPSCGDEKKVFHTCKSRFCPSCGIAQTKRWVEQYEVLFADTTYRHFMFHPPSEFRQYFGVGKTPYFNMLYATVHQTLKQWYAGKKDYLPGIMAVKHTFGRDEKFTPHIHVLMTCGGLDATRTMWVNDDFYPYEFFRKHFKENFLTNMQELWTHQQLEKIPSRYHFLFTPLYKTTIIQTVLAKTWYVYVGKALKNAFNSVKYIARYTKRPPIAESRISDYDGCSVTFNFVDHKTSQLTYLTLPVEEFIGKIITHIPDNNFRVVRYYGFFSNKLRGKLLPKVFTLCNQNYRQAKENVARLGSLWRRQLALFTNLDPLMCAVCFVPLNLVSVVYCTKQWDSYG